MFHELMVEEEVITESATDQVQESSSDVCDNEQRDELSQRIVGKPRLRIDVRRKTVLVNVVQHNIHADGEKRYCSTAKS